MKSLVKLIVSLLVKLAFIALIYEIVMGLTGCTGCSNPDILSSSTANIEETEITSETVMSESSEEALPTSFGQANIEHSEESTVVSETTKTIEVEESTQQTKQTIRSTDPVRVNSDQTQLKATSTPTPKPTSTPKPISTQAPTKAPTATPQPTATPTPEPTEAPVPTSTPKPSPTSKPVWGWKKAKGTIRTTYDSATNGSNIPIDIPNMPVSGETCDGKLTGYGKATDATEEAVWAYLDNKFGEDFCGVGHLKVVDGSVH